jgi:hypothetical protein
MVTLNSELAAPSQVKRRTDFGHQQFVQQLDGIGTSGLVAVRLQTKRTVRQTCAQNPSFPNGSLPGTMNTTSSVIKLSTVCVSPFFVASNHFAQQFAD